MEEILEQLILLNVKTQLARRFVSRGQCMKAKEILDQMDETIPELETMVKERFGKLVSEKINLSHQVRRFYEENYTVVPEK